jgi:hypothetical protein
MRKLRSAEAPRGVPSLSTSSAFAKRHNEILSTFYKGTNKKHTVRRIRFVVPEVAIVDIDNEVRGVKAMPGGIALPTIALGRGRF